MAAGLFMLQVPRLDPVPDSVSGTGVLTALDIIPFKSTPGPLHSRLVAGTADTAPNGLRSFP